MGCALALQARRNKGGSPKAGEDGKTKFDNPLDDSGFSDDEEEVDQEEEDARMCAIPSVPTVVLQCLKQDAAALWP